MAIPFANPTIPTVYKQLAPLVLGNGPCAIDGLCLRAVNRGRSVISGTTHRPPVLVRNNVLIFT